MYIEVKVKGSSVFLNKTNKNTLVFLFRDGNKITINLKDIYSYSKNGNDFTIVENSLEIIKLSVVRADRVEVVEKWLLER